jgi:hypothetical protein
LAAKLTGSVTEANGSSSIAVEDRCVRSVRNQERGEIVNDLGKRRQCGFDASGKGHLLLLLAGVFCKRAREVV